MKRGAVVADFGSTVVADLSATVVAGLDAIVDLHDDYLNSEEEEVVEQSLD